MREIKEEAKDIVYMDEINHECTLACPPGPIYVVWLQQSIVTNHILQTAFIHVFLYSCIWIGKLFNSHIFGTNLTYCHWFEHNGEYFLNFLRRFSGFWKPICQRPSWISWGFRKKILHGIYNVYYTCSKIHCNDMRSDNRRKRLTSSWPRGSFSNNQLSSTSFTGRQNGSARKSITFVFDRCYNGNTNTAQIYNEIPYSLTQVNVLFRQTRKKLEN